MPYVGAMPLLMFRLIKLLYVKFSKSGFYLFNVWTVKITRQTGST